MSEAPSRNAVTHDVPEGGAGRRGGSKEQIPRRLWMPSYAAAMSKKERNERERQEGERWLM